LAPLRVPSVEFGKGVVHHFRTRAEIALLGRLGEPL
jgi:hypothetical protein